MCITNISMYTCTKVFKVQIIIHVCVQVCVYLLNNIMLTFGLVNTDILVSSLENQDGEYTHFSGISTLHCLSSEVFIVLFTSLYMCNNNYKIGVIKVIAENTRWIL